MGAGKGHTLRELLKKDIVRLPSNTVWCVNSLQRDDSMLTHCPPDRIDPDALSRHLPERPQYLHADASTASALLHPEASLVQEIIAAAAKKQRRSLVVDGSLTDKDWFEGFMRCGRAALVSLAENPEADPALFSPHRTYHQAGYDCEILFVVRFAFRRLFSLSRSKGSHSRRRSPHPRTSC